jgi:CRISPR/Cas system CSM-associated protein Csm4 (group 5 of RAMP superfamily)
MESSIVLVTSSIDIYCHASIFSMKNCQTKICSFVTIQKKKLLLKKTTFITDDNWKNYVDGFEESGYDAEKRIASLQV